MSVRREFSTSLLASYCHRGESEDEITMPTSYPCPIGKGTLDLDYLFDRKVVNRTLAFCEEYEGIVLSGIPCYQIMLSFCRYVFGTWI
jgi:hypothetical protein